MINPINKPADFNRTVQTEQSASTKGKSKPTTDSPEQSVKEVNLSEAFREIEKLRELVDNTSEINDTRIEYLKSLVDSGDYEVDSQAIANRIINE